MRKTFEVVDDFHTRPMFYRDQGLKSVAAQPHAKLAAQDEPRCDVLDDPETAAQIFRILGKERSSAPPLSCRYHRFRGDGTYPSTAPWLQHYDWAALICLSLSEASSAGVSFYRLSQSELGSPSTDHILGNSGHSIDDPALDLKKPLGHADSRAVTLHTPMRFNRMVLFQPSVLDHAVILHPTKGSERELLFQVLALSECPSPF